MKGYHKIAKTPAIKCSHFINFEIVKTKLAGLRLTKNGKQICIYGKSLQRIIWGWVEGSHSYRLEIIYHPKTCIS